MLLISNWKIDPVYFFWVILWIIFTFFTYRIVELFSLDIRNRKFRNFTTRRKIILYLVLKLVCIGYSFGLMPGGSKLFFLNDALLVSLLLDIHLFIFAVIRRTPMERRIIILERILLPLRIVLLYWVFSLESVNFLYIPHERFPVLVRMLFGSYLWYR